MLKENSSEEYRNKKDFLTAEKQTIDAGSLWRRNGNKLILVDDDNYVETELDLTLFEIAN
jgi:hypothetical protein